LFFIKVDFCFDTFLDLNDKGELDICAEKRLRDLIKHGIECLFINFTRFGEIRNCSGQGLTEFGQNHVIVDGGGKG